MDALVLSEDRAAEILTLSVKTLRRWRVEGRGPRYVKMGRRVAYTQEALRDFVASSERTALGRRVQPQE